MHARVATSTCLATSMHVLTSNAGMHHSVEPHRAPFFAAGKHAGNAACTPLVDVCESQHQMFLSGSDVQAGPSRRERGRKGSTRAAVTSIVDHIIASHADVSVASTVVHHDGETIANAPVPPGPMGTQWALSVHAAISPGRPCATREVSRRIMLDTLSLRQCGRRIRRTSAAMPTHADNTLKVPTCLKHSHASRC
jgi:hypothetical protein